MMMLMIAKQLLRLEENNSMVIKLGSSNCCINLRTCQMSFHCSTMKINFRIYKLCKYKNSSVTLKLVLIFLMF